MEVVKKKIPEVTKNFAWNWSRKIIYIPCEEGRLMLTMLI